MKASVIMSTLNGSAQFRSHEVRPNTLSALRKAGYHYCSSGGWTAISAPDVECPEPGSHILDRDFGIINETLQRMEPGFGYWTLYYAVERDSNFHFGCCAPFDAAIRFAVRKGYIAKADWMKHCL